MTDPIVAAVRADLLRRSTAGIAKYHTTLARTDLSPLAWHQHHYEELLDAALYVRRIITDMERTHDLESAYAEAAASLHDVGDLGV